MRERIKDNRRLVLIIALVMLVQCIVLVYWQGQKGNYYIDELYSFGYAKNLTADETHYITEAPPWKYDTWIDAGSLRGQLIVTDNDSLLSMAPAKTLHLLLHKRAYWVFLNLIMSVSEPFNGYSHGALALNMVFFLIAGLLMAYCVQTMTENKVLTVLSLVMFGFSALMLGLCEYIRFYMLVIMLLMIVLLCHLKLWKTDTPLRFFMLELIAFVSAYFGLKHSELILVICGSFFCFFFVSLLLRKKIKCAVIYAVPLLAGMYAFVYQKTNLLDVVFHPSNYADPSGHGTATVTYKLLTITSERAGQCLLAIKSSVVSTWFGGPVIALAFLAALAVCLVLTIKRRSSLPEKDASEGGYGGFVILLTMTAITGVTFNVLTDLSADRYNSLFIVLLMLVLWYCVGILDRRLGSRKALAAFAVLTVAGAAFCQQPGTIPFLYAEDKPVTTAVESYEATDSIIFGGFRRETYDIHLERHAAYDVIAHTDSAARLYVMDSSGHPSFPASDAPDRFLAWCINESGVEQMETALQKTDYEITPIGRTQLNDIYLCSKKDH